MIARTFLALALALALGAGAIGCAGMPDLLFVPDDASTASGPAPTTDGAATIDGAAVSPADAATSGDSATASDPDASSDGALASDTAPPPADSGLACLPAGAPAGTLCCPNGDACIGPACGLCNQCNCATTEYCCATENGGGHVQGTSCQSSPTTAQCPTK